MSTKDNLTPLIPKTGFFNLYHHYTDGTEVCPRFRFFAAFAAVGAVTQRKLYIQRGTKDTFPTLFLNPWIVLVAPQGRGHKSSSLRVALKLIQGLEEKYHPTILAAKITPEALIKALACHKIDEEALKTLNKGMGVEAMAKFMKKEAIATLVSSELGVLLSKDKYNQSLITLLTDLYDCADEWKSDTVMRGDQRLYNICLTIAAATTPEWMQSMLPADTFKTGFMSRLFLIVMPIEWSTRVANPPVPDPKYRRDLLVMLERLACLKGRISLTPEADKVFTTWYMSSDKKLTGPVAAYLERKQDHLLRMSAILQICDGDYGLIIQAKTIQLSLDIMHVVEQDTLQLMDFIATEPRMRSAQEILNTLREEKAMEHSALLRKTWRGLKYPRDFQDQLQLLLDSKEVVQFQDPVDSLFKYKINKKDIKI